MLKVQKTFLLFFLQTSLAFADSENGTDPSGTQDTSSYSNFPSISSFSSSDGPFSIPQPSLDLTPTQLARNSPMSFSIPSLELNLAETDFARNSPMSFSITQPAFDLKPSFKFEQYPEGEVSEESGSQKATKEVKTTEDDKLPLEPQINPKEIKISEKERKRREAPDFPSIFTFRSSNDPFSIAFPSPDLSPGQTFSKLQDPVLHSGGNKKTRQTKLYTKDLLSNEISDATHHGKRQVSFFNFRPSPLFSQSGGTPAHTFRPVNQNSIRPTKFKQTQQKTKPPRKPKGSKFAALDPVFLLPQTEEAVRPVRQNHFRLPPSYPPFDPFNTTYIPLPGPSSPSYALPLAGGNPHTVAGSERALFRRPIRQSLHSPVLPTTRDLRSQFGVSGPENDIFRYKSSKQFEASDLGRFFRSKHKSIPK